MGPLLNRAALAELLHDRAHLHAWRDERCDDACGIAAYQSADAVLELARPMPTQQAIARAIYEQDLADGAVRPSPWESADEETRVPYERTAWAVLALFCTTSTEGETQS